MTINLEGGGHITIDDNSEEAIKINEGYAYSIDNGKIVIGKKTDFDKNSFIKKIKNKTATMKDINEYIEHNLL